MTDHNACNEIHAATISHLVITVDYIPEQQIYVARADRFPKRVVWAETIGRAVKRLLFIIGE